MRGGADGQFSVELEGNQQNRLLYEYRQIFKYFTVKRNHSLRYPILNDDIINRILTAIIFFDKKDVLYHYRCQMPVGQGGFHVGLLSLQQPPYLKISMHDYMQPFDNNGFLYVYDCGSIPKEFIIREVNGLIKKRKPHKIDMLFLSHFDCDHICGTPNLLAKRKGLKVNTIVIPYVDDAERLLAFGRAIIDVEDGNGRIDSFFREMIINPITTLQSYEPEIIIQIMGEDDEPPAGLEPREQILDDEDGSFRRILVPSNGTLSLQSNIWEKPTSSNGRVFISKNNEFEVDSASISTRWRLKPWVRKINSITLDNFKRAVETQVSWTHGSFDSEISKSDTMRNLVTKHRTKVATAYKNTFGDKNLTSLCLFSGPDASSKINAATILPYYPFSSKNDVAWIGTGDIPLKKSNDINDFEAAYKGELSDIVTYMFPHHGSIENSDPSRLPTAAYFRVVSADPSHEWEHPHSDLVKAATGHGNKFRHVRTIKLSAFAEAMILYPKPEDHKLPNLYVFAKITRKNILLSSVDQTSVDTQQPQPVTTIDL